MRRDKKPVTRWIGEAILIFLSVFGAFYFDNLREERGQKKLYIQYLQDFKSDLQVNQAKFAHELDPIPNATTGRGYLNRMIRNYDFVDSILDFPNRTNGDTLMELIESNVVSGLSKWIFTSQQYDKLTSQYYSYIKNDSLRNRLEMHYRNNLSRHNFKSSISEGESEFEDLIEDQLNFKAGGAPSNRVILFSNQSINKIRRMRSNVINLKNFTQFSKTNDSLLLVLVDKELTLWGK